MLQSGPSTPFTMHAGEKGWETQFLARWPHAQWHLCKEKWERPLGWPADGPPGTVTHYVQTSGHPAQPDFPAAASLKRIWA